jgi:hypothetical protein
VKSTHFFLKVQKLNFRTDFISLHMSHRSKHSVEFVAKEKLAIFGNYHIEQPNPSIELANTSS